eukprot:scaffold1974_cov395-Prasinococcus_capsulatus_cf.AAC.8
MLSIYGCHLLTMVIPMMTVLHVHSQQPYGLYTGVATTVMLSTCAPPNPQRRHGPAYVTLKRLPNERYEAPRAPGTWCTDTYPKLLIS